MLKDNDPVNGRPERLPPPFNRAATGQAHSLRRDIYHLLLTRSWPEIMVGTITLFLAINLIFALLYQLLPAGAVVDPGHGRFADYFFFSVQTLSTVGYGQMYPGTDWGNAAMTLEAITGAFLYALITGVFFARFSHPTARVQFSEVAVIAPFNGVPTLMLRAANHRRSQLLQADVTLTLLRRERTREGHFMMRQHDLRLFRSQTPFFALTWLIMHPIDESSPLFNQTSELLQEDDAQIAVLLFGTDETLNRTVHARMVYRSDQIRFGRRFADVFEWDESNQPRVNLTRLNLTEPLDQD